MVEEERRVFLGVLSFQGYALSWRTFLVLQKRRKGQPEIEYWFDLKAALHARHVPLYYKRELMDKLQRVQERSMSVEEYRQKMELYILRARIEEKEDLTIVRFLSDLNYNIRDRIELLPDQGLNDLVQMCIKAEQQLLRRPSRKDSSISFPKSDFPKDSKKDFSKKKETTHRIPTRVSEKGESSTNKRAIEIKCFKCLGRGHVVVQCPTKRTIVLKGKDLYSSQEESASSSGSESSHSSASKEHSFTKEGNLLMIRRLLSNQLSLPLNDQRENIFHTRCDVLTILVLISLIVDHVAIVIALGWLRS